ncbi:MAG: DUF370 domain-containing protein [Clostridia bacterium]|nr:DUF370 domain-containing protein [Clostridia bacterium]
MFVHIGNDYIINDKEIIAVFDIDNSSISVKTRNFLSKAEKEGRIINISTDIPRSFIVCEPKEKEEKHIIYLSQLSSSTILKRIEKEIKESLTIEN